MGGLVGVDYHLKRMQQSNTLSSENANNLVNVKYWKEEEAH